MGNHDETTAGADRNSNKQHGPPFIATLKKMFQMPYKTLAPLPIWKLTTSCTDDRIDVFGWKLLGATSGSQS